MPRQSIEDEDFKKTVLDDDAGIYQKREEKTEKEKWKDMDNRERRRYFRDYYLLKIFLIIVAVAGLAYAAYTLLRPRVPVALYLAYVYGEVDDAGADRVKEEFAERAGINMEEEQIIISDEFYTDDKSGLSATEKIITLTYTNQLDLVVADEECFEQLAADGNIVNLKGYLDEELFSKIEPYIFSCSYSELLFEEDKAKGVYPFGFYVKDNEVYKTIGCTELENPVIGVMESSRHRERTIEFIKYMTE